jgi:hypothetical protein
MLPIVPAVTVHLTVHYLPIAVKTFGVGRNSNNVNLETDRKKKLINLEAHLLIMWLITREFCKIVSVRIARGHAIE